MASEGGKPCSVCAQSAAKYRCPGCRQRYCSVPCYKKHKEQCSPSIAPSLQPVELETGLVDLQQKTSEGKGISWSADGILAEGDEGDKVPLQSLQRLEHSEELQHLLLNPHLQRLLLAVDRAEDKGALLRGCMQEPLFVEFADCCLRVIEPPPEEEESDPLE